MSLNEEPPQAAKKIHSTLKTNPKEGLKQLHDLLDCILNPIEDDSMLVLNFQTNYKLSELFSNSICEESTLILESLLSFVQKPTKNAYAFIKNNLSKKKLWEL